MQQGATGNYGNDNHVDTQVIVGVLYPPNLDPDVVSHAAASAGRRIEVTVAHYEENAALRDARRSGAAADELRTMAPPLTDHVRDVLARAEVILALDAPVDLLTLAPHLRWIQAIGAGVSQFDEKALDGRGIRLTTAAGVGAPPIAEFVLGRLLQVWKDFRHFDEMQAAHVWRLTSTRLLAGCTIGIVGLGAIGTAIAERARAFGMRVIAIRRRFVPGMTSPVADQLLGTDGLDELLAESDAIVLSAPHTNETENLIGERELARMKPGSVLCNVGRGARIDEDALVSGLAAGRPAAAILDVTREEPLPKDSPLWDAPNLYLSPHSSAVHDRYFEAVINLFVANLVRYLNDEPLLNLVRPEVGY
jgi:phosphoglycerate dehydrogenase-like enzyme